jgi:hypothetical protein
MNIRVRGAGASPANSQALIMHLRGAKTNARARPASEYPVQITKELTTDEDADDSPVNVFRWVLPRYHPFIVQLDTLSADAGAVWKEIHNVYDIAYDEDEDTSETNPLGSVFLGRCSVKADLTHILNHDAARRILAPAVFVPLSALKELGMDDTSSTAQALSITLVIGEAPSNNDLADLAPVSMRRNVTAVAYIAYRYAAALQVHRGGAETRLRIVLPGATMGTGVHALLMLVWAVAVGGYFVRGGVTKTEPTREGATAEVLTLLREVQDGRVQIVSADSILSDHSLQERQRTNKSESELFVAISTTVAQSLSGRGVRVEDATAWIAGDVPSARVFDLSAAVAAAQRERRRENFCPCCGNHDHDGESS